MEKKIINQVFDEERALYHLENGEVADCTFAGPKDGESALKEARNVRLLNCSFSLRYPLWHAKGYTLLHSSMDEKTRAPIWYAENGEIQDCTIHGVKCLRECQNTTLRQCKVVSPEFGWRCRNVHIIDCDMESEYFLFECENVDIERLKMRGKYSFQYIRNMKIRDSVLDTKDAFWHSENVTVENSVVKGEYLGWFSKGLTLINCKIIGTQPLCYCENLKLINCTMEGTDLSFEYSDVEADIQGDILSVKNPRSGKIVADSVGEIIHEDPVMECTGEVILRNKE